MKHCLSTFFCKRSRTFTFCSLLLGRRLSNVCCLSFGRCLHNLFFPLCNVHFLWDVPSLLQVIGISHTRQHQFHKIRVQPREREREREREGGRERERARERERERERDSDGCGPPTLPLYGIWAEYHISVSRVDRKLTFRTGALRSGEPLDGT